LSNAPAIAPKYLMQLRLEAHGESIA
jgi:hypothetical protein